MSEVVALRFAAAHSAEVHAVLREAGVYGHPPHAFPFVEALPPEIIERTDAANLTEGAIVSASPDLLDCVALVDEVERGCADPLLCRVAARLDRQPIAVLVYWTGGIEAWCWRETSRHSFCAALAADLRGEVDEGYAYPLRGFAYMLDTDEREGSRGIRTQNRTKR